MEIKPIRMMSNVVANAKDDALAALDQHFHIVTEVIQKTHRQRYAGATVGGGAGDVIVSINIVSDFLALMSRLDGEYGPDRALPIEDVPDAVDETLRCLAELESWLIRFDQADQLAHLQAVEIGVGYWAMRHGLPILAVEPIVNALATRSNAAKSTQETAAVYAMMQGFISHFSPSLKADLELSNPQRPWRLLNLNFAITGIRTGDAALMRYAFDTLNSHLPADRTGFYEDAQALASQPGFPPATRVLIEAEFARWTRIH